MEIRSVSENQIEKLFALYHEYNRPRETNPDLESALRILYEIRAQGGEIFVAIDDEILGTYMVHICKNLTRSGRPYAVVENVICTANARRSGIGRALMDHAILYAKQLDCYKILLQTGENRTENHRFYEACGFQGGKRAFQIRF